MPFSIVQGILETLLHGVFEFLFYYAGRVIVPVISFGRWKCDRFTADVPRKKLRVAGIYHLRGQQVYLTAQATQLAGMLGALVIIGLGVMIWYFTKK